METEYLKFCFSHTTGKTDVWSVVSKKHDDVLGEIKWHGAWRQYAFFPNENTIWNRECLADVMNFISMLMETRKTKSCPSISELVR